MFSNNIIEKKQINKKTMGILTQGYKNYLRNKSGIMSVLTAVADAVYVIDNEGVIIDANKYFSDLVGMKEDELIGRYIEEIWHEKMQCEELDFITSQHEKKMPQMGLINGVKQKKLKIKKPKAVGQMALEERKEVSVITRIARKNKTAIMTGIPFFNDHGIIEYVVTVIRDATETIHLKEKLENLEKDKKVYLNELKYLRENQIKTDIVGQSSGTEKTRQVIYQVAKTDITVLITGETGVGKEVVAREIYKNSERKSGPYIKVNCAAIPDNLLESELFGYEKGAFTGAENKSKLGLFEMANQGTLLLDEIGEMPLSLQPKLLRVLQEKEIIRVGGTKSIKVDVRVIAATNENLQELIKEGKFREDLYYRLNVFPIRVLPLRERKEDISILAYHFVEIFNKKYSKNKSLEKGAIESLEDYSWPGNIRELQNIIERLVVADDKYIITSKGVNGTLGRDTLPSNLVENDNITLKEAVNLLEKQIIEKALKKYRSTYKAADILGIKQSTVVKKAKVLGIEKWR